VVLLAFGIILLLDRLGIVYLRDIFQFWPMVLVGGGLVLLTKPAPLVARAWFGMMVVAGLLLQANNSGYIHLRGELFWPLVLIGIGIVSLIHAMESRANPPKNETQAEDGPGQAESGSGPADFWPGGAFFRSFGGSFVHGSSVFSGLQRKVADQDFRRAHISAVFGGFDLDLRSAEIKGDEAYVTASAVFGGIEIRVPETWDVILRASGIFGGVTDETKHPDPNTAPPPKRLIVRGSAVFGGIVVKNSSKSMWQ
jgi:hypothetical protein